MSRSWVRGLVAAVLLLLVGGARGDAQEEVPVSPTRYAILLAVDASDNVAALRGVIGSALARVSARDEEPSEPGVFNRFILADTYPEANVRIYVGYEATAGERLLALIDDIPQVALVQTSFASPITRTEMLRRLRARARNDGYQRVWDLRQGSRTDGVLVQRFQDVDAAP